MTSATGPIWNPYTQGVQNPVGEMALWQSPTPLHSYLVCGPTKSCGSVPLVVVASRRFCILNVAESLTISTADSPEGDIAGTE